MKRKQDDAGRPAAKEEGWSGNNPAAGNEDHAKERQGETGGGHHAGGVNKWEMIGYHRVLGGFYWQVVFFVLGIAYMMLLPAFVPFPESMGYYNILTGIFSSIFTFADMGTAGALSRFVAEYRVKDPRRVVQYIRFFIVFQSTTGLAQTTIVSIIGLVGLGGTSISFMPWLFVWLSIIQYPGYLGVFVEALKGFQHYSKVSLVGLLNMVFFQSVTLIAGAQLGAWLGNMNPRIGGILGASIGMVIGYYVDDFSTLAISGWMFSRLLKPMGYRIKDLFSMEIDRDVVVQSLKFGAGIMLFVLSYQVPGTIIAFIYASFLPNYSSYIGLLSVLSPVMGLAETVNGLHTGNHRATVSEAYFNKKHDYAEYVLSNGFRTIGQVSFLVIPLLLVLGPAIVRGFFPNYYYTFLQVFAVKLVHSTIFQHSHLMNEVLIGTGHHKFNVLITVLEQVVGMVAILACIYFQLGIWVLIIPGFFSTGAKQGLGWVLITTRIVNLHFNPWQMWISTAMAGTVYFFFISFLNGLLALIAGEMLAAIVMVLLGIYVLPGLGYFLPLGLLGGYDDHTMEDFANAVELSGPSKIVVKAWLAGARLGARLSPLHGKFPMYYDGVAEDIKELQEMKGRVDGITRNA